MPIKLINFNFFILQRSLGFRFAAITHAGDFLISRAGDAPYFRLRVSQAAPPSAYSDISPFPSAWKGCRSELDRGYDSKLSASFAKNARRSGRNIRRLLFA